MNVTRYVTRYVRRQSRGPVPSRPLPIHKPFLPSYSGTRETAAGREEG